jgi:anti-anti-sigma factor
MEVTFSQKNDVIIVQVTGSIDALTADILANALLEQINNGETNMVVDLSGVEFISSAGLRALLNAQKEIRKIGGDICLSSPNPQVGGLLKISGFASIFKTFDETNDAVNSFDKT